MLGLCKYVLCFFVVIVAKRAYLSAGFYKLALYSLVSYNLRISPDIDRHSIKTENIRQKLRCLHLLRCSVLCQLLLYRDQIDNLVIIVKLTNRLEHYCIAA